MVMNPTTMFNVLTQLSTHASSGLYTLVDELQFKPDDNDSTRLDYLTDIFSDFIQPYLEASTIFGGEMWKTSRNFDRDSPLIIPSHPDRSVFKNNIAWAMKTSEGDNLKLKEKIRTTGFRHIWNQSRSTIYENGRHVHFARFAQPTACGFCRMLATRGAVYSSQKTASTSKNGSAYHDHCRCIPVPGDEFVAPAQYKHWGKAYDKLMQSDDMYDDGKLVLSRLVSSLGDVGV